MIRPCHVGTCKLGPICQRPCVSEALGYRNVVLMKAPKKGLNLRPSLRRDAIRWAPYVHDPSLIGCSSLVLAKGKKKSDARVFAEKLYGPYHVGPFSWGTTCQRIRGVKPRLEEYCSREGQKKALNFLPEFSQRSYPLLSAGLERTREGGSPLVPALSGQSQTEKVTLWGRE